MSSADKLAKLKVNAGGPQPELATVTSLRRRKSRERSVRTVAGVTAHTGGDHMVSRAFIGGSMVSTQMADAQFMPALAGRVCGLYVRASVSPGAGQACQVRRPVSARATLLHVLFPRGSYRSRPNNLLLAAARG